MNRDFLKRYIKYLVIQFSITIVIGSLKTPWNSSGWGFSLGRILEEDRGIIYLSIFLMVCSSYIFVFIDRAAEKRGKKK